MEQDRREIISRAANFAEAAHLNCSGPTPEGCEGIALALAATAAADALDELCDLCRADMAPATPVPPIIQPPACPACDGSGVAQEGPPVILCELCDGSGLAHPDTAALWRLAFLLGTHPEEEELDCPCGSDVNAIRAATGSEPPCWRQRPGTQQCARCWLAWARAGDPDNDPQDLGRTEAEAAWARAQQVIDEAQEEPDPAPQNEHEEMAAALERLDDCGAGDEPAIIIVRVEGGLVTDAFVPGDGQGYRVAVVDLDGDSDDPGRPWIGAVATWPHGEAEPDGWFEEARAALGL